jgi:hypothetical protein
MGEALASFRDLKGIGPATEARLHETGVYTWEALAAAASALASVRGNGDTLREIAGAVAARRTEENGGEADAHTSGDGERLEAFVLRMSLSARGEPQRCEVTHVRTMAEKAWAGWRPTELAGFIQKHAKIRPEPAPRKEPVDKEPAAQSPSEQPSSADHVLVLDAGKAIGGRSRDIDLVVTNTRSAGGAFGYRATLARRGLGAGQNGDGWINLGTRTGTGSAGADLALGFQAVQLPSGIHRLQLRLEVSLPALAKQAPALSLA